MNFTLSCTLPLDTFPLEDIIFSQKSTNTSAPSWPKEYSPTAHATRRTPQPAHLTTKPSLFAHTFCSASTKPVSFTFGIIWSLPTVSRPSLDQQRFPLHIPTKRANSGLFHVFAGTHHPTIRTARLVPAESKTLVRRAVHAIQYWLPLPGAKVNEYAHGEPAISKNVEYFTSPCVQDFPWPRGFLNIGCSDENCERDRDECVRNDDESERESNESRTDEEQSIDSTSRWGELKGKVNGVAASAEWPELVGA